MLVAYVFQIDCAQNNDAFFNALRSTVSHFYRGIAFRVGDAPWIPDGIRVEIGESQCAITLIELEDSRTSALVSARKYLPENSNLILRSVGEYLDRVISQCRSTGDSREASFTSLREILTQDIPVTVQTACALRSSAEIIEQLPLIDQPHGVRMHGLQSYGTVREDTAAEVLVDKPQQLQGVLKLDVEKAKSLGRCVLVLDAVIRNQDHSASTCHGWRNKAPLKRSLRHTNGNPTLRNLVIKARQTGLTLDFEALLAELVGVWASANFTLEDIRRAISDYLPTASRIRGNDRMERVFEDARNCLKVGSGTF